MASDIELKQFSGGSYNNNVYMLIDPESRESVVFDAPLDVERVVRELDGTSIKYILMTHCDADHVTVLKELKKATNAPIGVHPAEMDRLPVLADFELHDGQEIPLGPHTIRALATPGHSPGGMSFLVDDILIGGDTLFPGGPGNTKRPDGDFDQIIDSIRTKLMVLPDNTGVFPGHGSPTTIGEEKPHLQEWIDRGW